MFSSIEPKEKRISLMKLSAKIEFPPLEMKFDSLVGLLFNKLYAKKMKEKNDDTATVESSLSL